MNKFIVMNGSNYAEIEESKITFRGGYTGQKIIGSDKEVVNSSNLIFNEKFISGEISCNVIFPNDIPESFFLDITFSCNIQDGSFYSCAIKTFGHQIRKFFKKGEKYEFETISSSYSYNPKYNKNILLKILRKGSNVEFYIDNIAMCSANINFETLSSNCGLTLGSNSDIILEEYKVINNKIRAFCIMKFGDPYDRIYADVIKPIFKAKDINITRSDEIFSNNYIIDDIKNQINTSEIIIAEISESNPNVFYELGYAHALKKETIVLCDNDISSVLPFDVRGFRTVFYKNSIPGKTELEKNIQNHLNHIFEKYGIDTTIFTQTN
ncbi:hypothetical protein [Fluviispira vulneris]|uniref:hypothetical protein n=1 Tax=Fluviispira vulneris TaxID=2763012 RepID=UPI0016482790|nr:hypothetical protein [Fluviispira vulneris]